MTLDIIQKAQIYITFRMNEIFIILTSRMCMDKALIFSVNLNDFFKQLWFNCQICKILNKMYITNKKNSLGSRI